MKVTIKPGPCKLTTIVEAEKIDRKTIGLKVTSECKFFKPLEEELTQVDVNKEVFGKLTEGDIYATCIKYCKHPACPVACGIVKAVEAAAGMALPTDVSITFEK